MKPRIWLLLAATVLIAGSAAVLLLAASTPARAADSVCLDALSNLYNICKLALGGDNELLTFAQALNVCDAETDIATKTCWTSCAINNTNCGTMAACIDKCFDGATMCGFLIQLVYVDCNSELPAPNTGAPISESQAFQYCPVDTSGLFECYKNCAYTNWQLSQCQSLYECAKTCKGAADDDSVVTDDDGSPDDDTTDGNPPTLSHSSACGA